MSHPQIKYSLYLQNFLNAYFIPVEIIQTLNAHCLKITISF